MSSCFMFFLIISGVFFPQTNVPKQKKNRSSDCHSSGEASANDSQRQIFKGDQALDIFAKPVFKVRSRPGYIHQSSGEIY